MINKKTYISILVVIIFLLLWYIFTLNQTEREILLFPSPILVLSTFKNQFNEVSIFSLITWYRVILGLTIGSFCGFIIGLLMSYSKSFRKIIDPVLEIIRPIPPVALTPFFILWFGLGDLSQLLLISLGCFMIICISTYEAIKNINPVFIRVAKSLGADDFTLYKTVVIPAIIPSILPSLRVALASSFALTVAAEYLGAQGGLGYLIRNARTILQTETILLAAIILGIESLITDLIIRIIFKRLTNWLPNIE